MVSFKKPRKVAKKVAKVEPVVEVLDEAAIRKEMLKANPNLRIPR